MILTLLVEYSSALKDRKAMHSQYAVSVRAVHEKRSMHLIYVCLWPVACGVWNHASVFVSLSLSLSKCTFLYMCMCTGE